MCIGKNIARFRKEKGLTQAQLGEMLGVSNQSVSKWEVETSMPDVMLLPQISDVLECHIDELFSSTVKEARNEMHYDLCTELPWADDEKIRLVVCRGRKILQASEDGVKDITFKIIGNTGEISSDANIIVDGNVTGGCVTRGNLFVKGNITGECVAEGNIEVKEWILGECTSGGNISAGGNITGECTANEIIATKNTSYQK